MKLRLWKLGNPAGNNVPQKDIDNLTDAISVAKEWAYDWSQKEFDVVVANHSVDVSVVDGESDIVLMEAECIKYLKGNGFCISKDGKTY